MVEHAKSRDRALKQYKEGIERDKPWILFLESKQEYIYALLIDDLLDQFFLPD